MGSVCLSSYLFQVFNPRMNQAKLLYGHIDKGVGSIMRRYQESLSEIWMLFNVTVKLHTQEAIFSFKGIHG
jgi:hypothetical protein